MVVKLKVPTFNSKPNTCFCCVTLLAKLFKSEVSKEAHVSQPLKLISATKKLEEGKMSVLYCLTTPNTTHMCASCTAPVKYCTQVVEGTRTAW